MLIRLLGRAFWLNIVWTRLVNWLTYHCQPHNLSDNTQDIGGGGGATLLKCEMGGAKRSNCLWQPHFHAELTVKSHQSKSCVSLKNMGRGSYFSLFGPVYVSHFSCLWLHKITQKVPVKLFEFRLHSYLGLKIECLKPLNKSRELLRDVLGLHVVTHLSRVTRMSRRACHVTISAHLSPVTENIAVEAEIPRVAVEAYLPRVAVEAYLPRVVTENDIEYPARASISQFRSEISLGRRRHCH